MKDKPDEWVERSGIGADAEAFLRSRLGEEVQRRANNIIQAKTIELVNADPDDTKKGCDLRRDIHRARDAVDWMLEAINDGKQAREEIRMQEEGE